jgi:hypothetical protein
MAGRSVDLLIRVITDTKQAAAGMEKAGKSAEGMAGKMKSAALPAAAIGAGVVMFANKAVDSASRTQQAMGAVDSVFGDSAGQVKKWSQQASTSVGLAGSEYAELASVMGAQLKNMGVPMDQVAGKTNDLITMGADLAATYGGTTADAVNALGSALRGETDPIERYGISIKQADIAARQAKDGTKALTGEAGKQAKTAALLALATEQAGGAMGQFARETDSAAGSQQIATAQWEDAQSALGEALLPAMSTLADVLGSVAGFIKENSTLFMVIVGVIGAVAAAVVVLNAVMTVYTAITTIAASTTAMAWLAAIWPIALLVAAVLLVVGAIVLLWKKCDWFRNGVLAIWAAIRAAFMATVAWLKTAWSATMAAMSGAVNRLRAVINAVVNWLKAAWRATFAAISAVTRAAGAVVRAVFNVIKAVGRAVFAGLSAYVRAYLAVFRAVFNVVRSVASAVGNAVKALWRGVFSVASSYVRSFSAAFRSAFSAIRAVASSIASAVRSIWQATFNALRNAASGMASALSGPFRAVSGAVNSVIGAVRSLIGWLGRIKIPKISLPKIPGFNSTTTVQAAPAVAANSRAVAAPTRAAPAGVTIVIQGAIDPEATARQVRRVLAAHDRRMGLTGAGLRTGLV